MSANTTRVIALLAVAFAIVLYSPLAFAIGDDVTIGDFSCSGGIASGQLLVSGASCPTTLQIDNVFSFLLCNFEQLSGNILGHMYCGLVKELEPAVWALCTLAIIFFAISFTFGLTPATGREAIVFLLKIAFITAFATNAEMLVEYGYRFLVGGIKDGVQIALKGMSTPDVEGGADAFRLLDKFMYQLFQYATDQVSAVTREEGCKNAIFAVIAVMAIAFPLLSYLALMLIARIVMTFVRAAFGYIYAIVGITFLLILAPIFVPLYFFKQTVHFCEKWIGFMASYVIQMVLLFAFLAFILSLDVSSMVKNLPSLIMYQEQTAETSAFRMPWQYCTLCSFKVVDKDDHSKELTDSKSEDFISRAHLMCKDTPPKPINLTFAIAPDTGSNEMNSLIKIAGQGVLSLIVLAIAINHILTLIPSLAVKLAGGLGGGYAPQLGGGTSYYGNTVAPIPGGSLARDFEMGFKQSMSNRTSARYTTMAENVRQRKPITLSGSRSSNDTGASIRDGFNALVTGRGSNGSPLYTAENTPGASRDQLDQMNNPVRDWRKYLAGPSTRR